eukprot:1307192-Pleurochrysis_carterae.AAC.1
MKTDADAADDLQAGLSGGAGYGSNRAAAASAAGVQLYGEWQTDEYVPPAAVDGIVPRSVR